MHLIYASELFPQKVSQSLFLAGPSPRDPEAYNWRPEALRILEELGYEGHVFIPLQRDGSTPPDYLSQVEWEQEGLDRSDVILFWVPRELDSLPGFTTNVEFGQRCGFRNVVLGYPEDAPKTAYLKFTAERNFVEVFHSLRETVEASLKKIGPPALREGGECEVPSMIWRLPHFQEWLQAQKNAGNRLDGAKLEMAFGVGPRKGYTFFWAMHVNVYIASEKRHKSNEIVLSRPDIKHVVAYYPDPDDIMQSRVVLIREFRSPGATADGFIREVPGGSGMKKEAARETAVTELEEETGLRVQPDRLELLPVRQLAGTTTAHKAHVFSLALTLDEIEWFQKTCLVRHGNDGETEQCYNEVHTLAELYANSITDWANLGMISAAILGRN